MATSFEPRKEEGFRRRFLVDLLHALAGILAGLWLPLVVVRHEVGLDRFLALEVDMILFVIAGTSAALGWRRPFGWRHWLRVIRDVAVALPLWTLFHGRAPDSVVWGF